MFPDRFITLVSKQLSSSLTKEEEAELQQLLVDPALLTQYEHLKKFWQNQPQNTQPDVEQSLQKVLTAIREVEPEVVPVNRRNRFRWFAGAAMVVLVGAMTVVLWPKATNELVAKEGSPALSTASTDTKHWLDKQNAKGTRSVITLVDGSKVWLNADSRLEYPASFGGNTREVRLSGEAFFDVAKNKTKPFIIHLKNGTVRVLGTSFNIKAYDTDGVVETSVATGKVAFIPKKEGNTDTTFLTHNLKAVYSLKTGLVKTISTLSNMDKAWTEGKLIFANTSMDEIAATLERYFGKQVVINDEQLRSYRLTGSFENNSAEEILYYLSLIRPFTYRITETQIILSAMQ